MKEESDPVLTELDKEQELLIRDYFDSRRKCRTYTKIKGDFFVKLIIYNQF